LIWWVLNQIPLPPPFPLIVRVVMSVILIIILLQWLLPLSGYHRLIY
jgi:hypothetical protein